MRIHRVDAQFIKDLQADGYQNLTVSDVLDIAIRGPRFARVRRPPVIRWRHDGGPAPTTSWLNGGVSWSRRRFAAAASSTRASSTPWPPCHGTASSVPEDVDLAYGDYPVDIGLGQTISQPYIVAFMSEALDLKPTDRVLEIGTGSGYQTAVLAELAAEVYSIEVVPVACRGSGRLLRDLGYTNIRLRSGDGYSGWPDAAPFDAIIVTAAPDHLPQPLVDQLKVGGRMVVPIGRGDQELLTLHKGDDGLRRSSRLPVRFVPLTAPRSRFRYRRYSLNFGTPELRTRSQHVG